MLTRVCLEEMEAGWIAHVVELPGCFASHRDRDSALESVPVAIETYLAWCVAHGVRIRGVSGPIHISEMIRTWESEQGYEVNAFFATDQPAILKRELPMFRDLLRATRQSLLAAVDGLQETEFTRRYEGERWSILEILAHVAGAEWWYLERVGMAFDRAELPDDVLPRLGKVREYLIENLPRLASVTGVFSRTGEIWSARKVLRRALWHERDHTAHILQLRARS